MHLYRKDPKGPSLRSEPDQNTHIRPNEKSAIKIGDDTKRKPTDIYRHMTSDTVIIT
jgi:hypothetical protein